MRDFFLFVFFFFTSTIIPVSTVGRMRATDCDSYHRNAFKKITTAAVKDNRLDMLAYTHTHTHMPNAQTHLSACARGEKVFPQIAECTSVIRSRPHLSAIIKASAFAPRMSTFHKYYLGPDKSQSAQQLSEPHQRIISNHNIIPICHAAALSGSNLIALR